MIGVHPLAARAGPERPRVPARGAHLGDGPRGRARREPRGGHRGHRSERPPAPARDPRPADGARAGDRGACLRHAFADGPSRPRLPVQHDRPDLGARPDRDRHRRSRARRTRVPDADRSRGCCRCPPVTVCSARRCSRWAGAPRRRRRARSTRSIAEARSDALLHVLKGAGAEARRTLGAGRDAPPPRPSPLTEYPRQRTSRLPQYLDRHPRGGRRDHRCVARAQRQARRRRRRWWCGRDAARDRRGIPTLAPTTSAADDHRARDRRGRLADRRQRHVDHPGRPDRRLRLRVRRVPDQRGRSRSGSSPRASRSHGVLAPRRRRCPSSPGAARATWCTARPAASCARCASRLAGWRTNVTDLLYDTGSGEMRWRINDPAG